MNMSVHDHLQPKHSSGQYDAGFVAAINHLCHDQVHTNSWRLTIGPGCLPAAPCVGQIGPRQRSRIASQITCYRRDPKWVLSRCQIGLSAPGMPSGGLCGKVWKGSRSCPVQIASLGLQDDTLGASSTKKIDGNFRAPIQHKIATRFPPMPPVRSSLESDACLRCLSIGRRIE